MSDEYGRCSIREDPQVAFGEKPVHAEPPLVIFGVHSKFIIVAVDVPLSIIFDRSVIQSARALGSLGEDSLS